MNFQQLLLQEPLNTYWLLFIVETETWYLSLRRYLENSIIKIDKKKNSKYIEDANIMLLMR